MSLKLAGLTAATHTPFDAAGDLHLAAVGPLAEHLARAGVSAVFVGGTTGESHSLTVEERLQLAARWAGVLRGSGLRFVVHVGANCLADARALAAQAAELGADAVSALAPSYFKPRTLEDLIACCADVSASAPGVPFYYYDIPPMTGVTLPAAEFLERAGDRIPDLAGVKFSNPDQMAFQRCLRAGGGRFDVPWGIDECLLGALAFGAAGGVGSTYNFAAPLFRRLLDAFGRGDLAAARDEQFRAVELVRVLAGFGYTAAAKAAMGFLGVDVGPARLPAGNLTDAQREALRAELGEVGFFEWVG